MLVVMELSAMLDPLICIAPEASPAAKLTIESRFSSDKWKACLPCVFKSDAVIDDPAVKLTFGVEGVCLDILTLYVVCEFVNPRAVSDTNLICALLLPAAE